MSNDTSESPGNGGQRRRSRGGRNRNRNRRKNEGGSPRNDHREGGQGGNREGGRGPRSGNQGGNRGASRSGGPKRQRERREPKPAPLTWWQKLLKSIGLYKEPVRPARAERSAPKSNTRVAKSAASGSEESKQRRERKPKKPRSDNDEHRERRVPENVVVESNRLYLGNMSYDATENDIEELFKGIGNVRRVEIVYNRQTHRSKGYGFIDMMNKDEAKRAVEVLHDQFFMGRRLVVNGAKSQGPAGREEDEAPKPERKAEEPSQLNIEEPVAEVSAEDSKA